jgi:hypothetical protein
MSVKGLWKRDTQTSVEMLIRPKDAWTELVLVTSRTNTLIYREIVQSGSHININKLVSAKYALQVLKSVALPAQLVWGHQQTLKCLLRRPSRLVSVFVSLSGLPFLNATSHVETLLFECLSRLNVGWTKPSPSALTLVSLCTSYHYRETESLRKLGECRSSLCLFLDNRTQRQKDWTSIKRSYLKCVWNFTSYLAVNNQCIHHKTVVPSSKQSVYPPQNSRT